jgi:hypothetical protein
MDIMDMDMDWKWESHTGYGCYTHTLCSPELLAFVDLFRSCSCYVGL